MTEANYTAWRTRIIATIRCKNPSEIEKAVVTLYRSPGFAGIRKQVGKLVTLIKEEWRRSGEENTLPPGLPRSLGYAQRLPHKGQRLTAILRLANEASK